MSEVRDALDALLADLDSTVETTAAARPKSVAMTAPPPLPSASYTVTQTTTVTAAPAALPASAYPPTTLSRGPAPMPPPRTSVSVSPNSMQYISFAPIQYANLSIASLTCADLTLALRITSSWRQISSVLCALQRTRLPPTLQPQPTPQPSRRAPAKRRVPCARGAMFPSWESGYPSRARPTTQPTFYATSAAPSSG